jgi:hypothetical protein
MFQPSKTTLDIAQKATIVTLVVFILTTKMESAYQMLLLLVLLSQADESGQLFLEEAAKRIAKFYQLRLANNLPAEKQSKTGQRAFTFTQLRRTIVQQPYPIFERYKLLEFKQERGMFTVPAAVWNVLTADTVVRAQIRALAIDRLTVHYRGEGRDEIENLVQKALEGNGEEVP